jgi:hypothetical protein
VLTGLEVSVRRRIILSVLAVLVLVGVVGVYLVLRVRDNLPRPTLKRACSVQADGQVFLHAEQMANAATIAAVGIRRGLPERAVVVALATAFQESRLENLAGGDRDSIGLFQQRPSQGWGTPENLRDPRYAADRFYSALIKIKGWEDMRVTDAAQRVQRSAYPEAYERWKDESVVLTTALLGRATGAVACSVPGNPRMWGSHAAETLTRQIRLDWGEAGTASAGELAAGFDGLVGLALTVPDTRHGWQYAHWLVAHATEHGVMRVRYDGLEWTAKGGAWTRVPSEQAGPDRVIAEVYPG